MSPLWPDGRPIEVTILAERPREFRWRFRTHRIQRVSDHWRIHAGWWATELWRDYWEVTTHSGLFCVLYCDLLAGRWYLERIYE